MAKGKPGRKRKSGPRTPSGRLSRAYKSACADAGTPEGCAKRRALVGDADPALAASALGILLAHRHIDTEQHAAGLEYGRLHAAVYGVPWSTGSTGPDATMDRAEKVKRELRALESLMTTEQREVVANVAARGAIPNWFFVLRLTLKELPEDVRERDLLLSGLSALLKRDVRRAA
jgi:hypothetical protein